MTFEALQPLNGPIKSREFIVVDIETKNGDTQEKGFTRPFLVGMYDGNKFSYQRGNGCIDGAILELLTTKNEGFCFYAHFGGGFDWLHFLPRIKALGYWFEIISSGSTIIMVKVKRNEDSKHAPWVFLDSYKLIPIGLKKAAKAFKVETQKEEIDLNLHEDCPEWETYLKADCVSLYQILQKYHNLVVNHLNGEVGITAASTAMKTFRRSYMKEPIKRNVSTHDIARKAYYGGRVEIFRREAKNLNCYDINSCYPWAMLQSMPTGNCRMWEGEPPSYINCNYIGFIHAKVNVPVNTYLPVLPYRNKKGKLIFPVGEFSGYWSWEELSLALNEGAEVLEWRDSVWYESSIAFDKYVETLYQYRDSSRPDYDTGLAETCKILLNSLYGKFAQKAEREKIVLGSEMLIGADPCDPFNPDCNVWKVPTINDSDYIIPQISAHITALARCKLYSYLKIAISLGELAYCDTDSIITTADLSHLVSASLGALKDEGKGEKFSGVFLQPKLYCLKSDSGITKLAMKGYQDKDENSFNNVRSGKTISYKSLQKLGGMAKDMFNNAPSLKTITRTMKTEDEKRIYKPDGTTRPITIW
jgi:hypothetical protein